jgi:hypothetical protein
VLLRLASELDNASDHSLWYRADAAERAAVMQRTAPALVDMAAELGFPVLGLALSAAIETSGQGYLPAELRWRHFGVASFPPASARRRGAALLGQAIGALVRRLRHGRGAT